MKLMDDMERFWSMTDEERFWANVEKSGPDDCWEWQAGKTGPGYGSFWKDVKSQPAHRVAWEYTNGPIPDGLLACHQCDNRACCNPAHLFLGTYSDNMNDMVQKGRGNFAENGMKGQDNFKSKLTNVEVLEIRERYANGGVTQTQLGKEYKVDSTTISLIVRRKRWNHI